MLCPQIAILVLIVAICVQGQVAPWRVTGILRSHNNFRANVTPTAADMIEMTWSDSAAKTAQTWAYKCKFGLDPYLNGCGQNIYVSKETKMMKLSAWPEVVNAWYSEVANFTYGAPDKFISGTGNYIQLVWATSNTVGCGFTQCGGTRGNLKYRPYFNVYVCNYCPRGNIQGKLGTPYKKGAKCSECPMNSNCTSILNLCSTPGLPDPYLLRVSVPNFSKASTDLATLLYTKIIY